MLNMDVELPMEETSHVISRMLDVQSSATKHQHNVQPDDDPCIVEQMPSRPASCLEGTNKVYNKKLLMCNDGIWAPQP